MKCCCSLKGALPCITLHVWLLDSSPLFDVLLRASGCLAVLVFICCAGGDQAADLVEDQLQREKLQAKRAAQQSIPHDEQLPD